jgi:hypothetical protein
MSTDLTADAFPAPAFYLLDSCHGFICGCLKISFQPFFDSDVLFQAPQIIPSLTTWIIAVIVLWRL